ncbi:hypothetical protein AAL_03698 [Moelleriella libera RCEF 2490]|uniref:CPAF-like PDZ domain-containing protein n=1 Tax=Moelleriella libera RCEF 2490 TaxID=1081109 RepID=A0A168DGV1_9HYPO|nr:hypothetical protein AAL_03698 [Moelleriella libera RCEF 2490]
MPTLRELLLFALVSGLAAQNATYDPSKACTFVDAELREETNAARNPSEIFLNGQHAFDCLRTLPFDAERAFNFTQQIRKYVQFQSNLEALKDPPQAYLSPRVDILGGLDKIAKTQFRNQFDFDTAISDLFNSVNDGHLFIRPCSQTIFRPIQRFKIVSLSEDGIKLPEIYAFDDVPNLLARQTNAVSPIETINGMTATAYLQPFADKITNQDPDARWNDLFASTSRGLLGTTLGNGVFPVRGFSEGNGTIVKFRNGSSLYIKAEASLLLKAFDPSPQNLFNTSCLQSQITNTISNTSQDTTVRAPFQSGPKGFPEPYVRDPYNQIFGFNLDNDTAVMVVPTFEPVGQGEPKNQTIVFTDTATSIVSQAVASGRTKMIIDISSNGGGLTVLSVDFFKLFFPNETPYHASRFRRHTALRIAAKLVENLDRKIQTFIGFRDLVTPDQLHDFATLNDWLGNTTELGTPVTSLAALFNNSEASTVTSPIRGFGPAKNKLNKTQPFKPENILIISDGHCASTCSLFVDFMTNGGGVRSVSFGGRPQKGPMQVMGGTRGGQVFKISQISDLLKGAFRVFAKSNRTLLSEEEAKQLEATWPEPLERLPLRLSAGSVNVKNTYHKDDDDLPLQFVYQASDCRLFYTADNLMNPVSAWAAAKKAIWGGGRCVDGSTGALGSRASQIKVTPQSGNESPIDSTTGGGSRSSSAKTTARILLLVVSFATTFITTM